MSPPDPDHASLFGKAIDYVIGAITGLIVLVWGMLNSRITKIEDRGENTILRIEFTEHARRDEKALEDLRVSTIRIYEKIDEIKTMILEERRK